MEDWYWDKNNYKNLLKKSGGRNRVILNCG